MDIESPNQGTSSRDFSPLKPFGSTGLHLRERDLLQMKDGTALLITDSDCSFFKKGRLAKVICHVKERIVCRYEQNSLIDLEKNCRTLQRIPLSHCSASLLLMSYIGISHLQILSK